MNALPNLPGNRSAFDFTLPDPDQTLRQRRNKHLGLVMALVLVAILGRGLTERDTAFTASEATRIEKIEQALQDTKPVYGDREENGQQSLNRNPGQGTKKPGDEYKSDVDHAIKNWRDITARKGAHPSDWRRLGLALAIFGRTEALQTFQKLPLLYALHKPVANKPVVRSDTKRRRTRPKSGSDEETEEAFIWTPLIPPAQELALWTAVYGPGTIEENQVPARVAQVKSLELGWFESVVLSDLYAKANLLTDSRHAQEAALTSVRYLEFFDSIETNVRILSFPAVFFFFGWFLRKRNQNAPAAPVMSSMPAYGAYPVGYGPPLANVPPPRIPNVFSYHARMVAFVSYMALPLVLFLPLALLRGPIRALSADALGRLEAGLEIGGSLVTALVALLVLRRVDVVDRSDSAGAAPQLSFRETLHQLGYRSRRIPGDIAAGLVGYPALFVPLVLAAIVSKLLFSRFETPPHPVLMSVAALHTPFDRALLFFESAILPPLVEELMFRGLLYPALRERWGVAGGVALSAATFALVHPTLPGGFLPLWSMGAVWAFTYERRGSLLPSILMHALNNGLLIALEMSALSN